MSVVTNLILHMGLFESSQVGAQIDKINAFFPHAEEGLAYADDPTRPFPYGGTKVFEADIAMGAFNHLNLSSFLVHLRSLQWPDTSVVQVMVKEQDDDRFRIIQVFKEQRT